MPLKLTTDRQRPSVRDLPVEPGLPGLRLGDNRKRVVRDLPGPWVTGGYANWASLTTALTGTNNDLVYTAVYGGAAGNDITITYVDPPTNNAALGVVVTGSDIVVNLATNGSSVITSTAAQVKAAIQASTDASRLVNVANATGNDGTGVVTALAETPLAGGTDYVIGRA